MLCFRWISSLQDDDIEVLTTSNQITSKKAKVIITTYELLIRNTRASKKASVTDVSTYLGRHFPIVIFDESHLLKNYRSQRSGAANDFAKYSRRLLLLSGTPALSRPSELYAQIQMVDPQIFRSFPEYGKRYCAARQNRWGIDYTGSSNVEELQVNNDKVGCFLVGSCGVRLRNHLGAFGHVLSSFDRENVCCRANRCSSLFPR